MKNLILWAFGSVCYLLVWLVFIAFGIAIGGLAFLILRTSADLWQMFFNWLF
jgi:hypothetical protein